MDTMVLDATAAIKYDLLEFRACEAVDRARFELGHLNIKLQVLLGMLVDNSAAVLERKAEVQGSIKMHLPTVHKECDQAIQLLEPLAL